MDQSALSLTLYYDEPRLKMSLVGRIFVRVVTYVSYLFLIATALTFILSDIVWLKAAGALLLLWVVDLMLHWREADRTISEAPRAGRLNLMRVMAPATFAIIERSFERSSLTRRNFFLDLTLQLVGVRSVQTALKDAQVDPVKFRDKVEEFAMIPEESPRGAVARYAAAEELVIQAGREAILRTRRFILPEDLFSALFEVKDPMIERILGLFFEPRHN